MVIVSWQNQIIILASGAAVEPSTSTHYETWYEQTEFKTLRDNKWLLGYVDGKWR